MCQAREGGADPGLLHHADWLASLLHGRRTCSDWHNAARLGFDAATGAYPPWLLKQVRTLAQLSPAFFGPELNADAVDKSRGLAGSVYCFS